MRSVTITTWDFGPFRRVAFTPKLTRGGRQKEDPSCGGTLGSLGVRPSCFQPPY